MSGSINQYAKKRLDELDEEENPKDPRREQKLKAIEEAKKRLVPETDAEKERKKAIAARLRKRQESIDKIR